MSSWVHSQETALSSAAISASKEEAARTHSTCSVTTRPALVTRAAWDPRRRSFQKPPSVYTIQVLSASICDTHLEKPLSQGLKLSEPLRGASKCR